MVFYMCYVVAECHFYYLRDSDIYVHESCCLGNQRHPLTYVGRRRCWYGPSTKCGSSLFFQDQASSDTDRLHLNLAKSKIFKYLTIHNALHVGFTNQFIVISVQTKKVWEIGSKQNG